MASYSRMEDRSKIIRKKFRIVNLLLHDNPILVAQMPCPDDRLQLKESFEVELLVNQRKKRGAQ